MTNNARKINVEKGRQGFQETAKAEAEGGLADLEQHWDGEDGLGLDDGADDLDPEVDYIQPLVFDGAPDEDTRFNIVSAVAADDGALLRKMLPNIPEDRLGYHRDGIHEAWQNVKAEELSHKLDYAMGENLSLGRAERMLATFPDWSEETLTNDGSYDTHTGCKYVQGRDVKDAAKLIRADIAKAQKSGLLPQGKYSVRIERYAGGCSLQATGTVAGDPESFYDRDVIGYDDRRLAQLEATNRLDEISRQYARTRVATGYNEGVSTNFYHGASVQVSD